jgi:phosphoenolpyruvate carboxykinase (ATP)
VRAALNGALDSVAMRKDPLFGFDVPETCPDVPDAFLRPRDTWPDQAAYDEAASRIAAMFAENFEAYADGVDPAVREAGPRR